MILLVLRLPPAAWVARLDTLFVEFVVDALILWIIFLALAFLTRMVRRMGTTRTLVLVVVLLLGPGCVSLGSRSWVCADGAPAKILTDPSCTRGVCGYTCHPDRWKTP